MENNMGTPVKRLDDEDSVYALLKARLAEARKLAVLGAGSALRADDAAGVRVAEKLRGEFGAAVNPNLLICVGETAPENFCGKIAKFSPDLLIVIDAADLGLEAGAIAEIQPGAVGGLSFCSHMLPLKMMIDYLERETGKPSMILGVQYKDISFDGPMTPEIGASVDMLFRALRRSIAETLSSDVHI